MLFSTSIFDRFWFQLGPNLAPKSTPKPTQEPSKIDPKSHLIFDLFFDRFLIDLCSIFDSKIDKKSIKNRSTNHPHNTTTKKSKMSKKHWFLYAFCYFGHLMLGSKINKKRSKINPKTALKSMLQFMSIWEPTWTHFGRVLDVKMGPSWHQIAPKIDLQIDDKYDSISDRSWDRFWSILGPNLEPKSAQDLPYWSQERPKTPPRPLQDLPKPTQEQSKIDPKSKSYFWSVLGSIFVDFSSIFNPKIDQKSIKIDQKIIPIWTDSGAQLVWFLNLFRSSHPSLPNEPQVAEGEGRRWLAAGVFNIYPPPLACKGAERVGSLHSNFNNPEGSPHTPRCPAACGKSESCISFTFCYSQNF